MRVSVVEYLPRMMPLEDEEVSKTMEREFRKLRATVLTSTAVRSVRVTPEGQCEVEIEGRKGVETLSAGMVLSAVGVQANIEGIGLEELGVEVERGKIRVDACYRTSVPGIYAIGDIVPGPALAHVASAEGICCVEAICGLNPHRWTHDHPVVRLYAARGSFGRHDRAAGARAGIEYRVGRFPFTASGKATAAGEREGFVKLLFDADERLLGAHMVGGSVTEMLAEPTLARHLGATAPDRPDDPCPSDDARRGHGGRRSGIGSCHTPVSQDAARCKEGACHAAGSLLCISGQKRGPESRKLRRSKTSDG